MAIKRIGILTGGGDAPGLNAAIRAIVKKSLKYGYEVYGIKNGWLGLIEGDIEKLDLDSISGILHVGGTFLGTSRTNPYKKEGGVQKVLDNIEKFKLDCLITLGGEDTNSVSNKLSKEGVKCVGVPKTIDNDISGTDYTIGFDTALSITTDAIDKLHTTAASHHRVMVVEVMGRNTGWIAMLAGLAGGADAILIPEVQFDFDDIINRIEERKKRGKNFSLIVVAEGAKPTPEAEQIIKSKEVDEFGHVMLGGIGQIVKNRLKEVGYETRAVILGHLQRAGKPTAFDRILALKLGAAAVDLVKEEKFNRMVVLRGTKIIDIPIEEAIKEIKYVDKDLYELSKLFY